MKRFLSKWSLVNETSSLLKDSTKLARPVDIYRYIYKTTKLGIFARLVESLGNGEISFNFYI